MAQVKAICNFPYFGKDIKQGQVIEVSDDEAQRLIDVEAAVATDESVTPVETEVAVEETQSAQEVETTTAPLEVAPAQVEEQPVVLEPSQPTPEQIAQDLAQYDQPSHENSPENSGSNPVHISIS